MILAIDAPQAIHRAFGITHLSHLEQNTEVIYGVLNSAFTLISIFKPDKFVFCWDSKISLRKEVYPAYKGDRIEKDPDLYSSMWQQEAILKDIIPQLEWNQWEIEGLEADDLIANICKLDEEVIIVSNDSDLYQLLSPTVSMYFPTQKKSFTVEDFKAKFDIDPDMWMFKDAIVGTHNNVKGVVGIGIKRALDYLRKGDDSIWMEKIDKEFDNWQSNIRLVELPFLNEPVPKWNDLTLNTPKFIKICQLYDFKSFLNNLKQWRTLFNVGGESNRTP